MRVVCISDTHRQRDAIDVPKGDFLIHAGSDQVACEELLAAITRSKPRVHIFGHMHSGYGATQNKHTKFYDASLCDEAYDPINGPWVIGL